jgi:hypothetical protein
MEEQSVVEVQNARNVVGEHNLFGKHFKKAKCGHTNIAWLVLNFAVIGYKLSASPLFNKSIA